MASPNLMNRFYTSHASDADNMQQKDTLVYMFARQQCVLSALQHRFLSIYKDWIAAFAGLGVLKARE
jgi:hypothetical protein